ncbi:MAG TPA: hypothetical protein VHB74_01135 [Devosia sp.]|nr:hypothetical protein [Devosia sp.]
MLDESKRQRAMRQEVRIARQAMSIAAPINERIDSWQRSAARLVALGRRSRTYGAADDKLRQETEALLADVTREQLELHRRVEDLPAIVATNSRLLDTQRALASLAAELERALALFDREKASDHAESYLVPEPEYLEVGHQDIDLKLPAAIGR